MIAQASAPATAPAKPEQRDDVTTSKRDSVKAPSKPHVSLYVSPKVQRAVKMMALEHGYKRPHDVYIAAVRQFMIAHGVDFDALQSG